MAHRRVSLRLRTGVLAIGIGTGVLLLTAVPNGQQVQGRGKPNQIQAPTVGAPSIVAPTVVVPDATQIVQTQSSYSGQWMDPVRVEALIQASRQRLNYLPGEVLVKFKDGVGRAGQARALDALGAHPTADDIEWAGSVAIVRDSTEPNAYILADRMKSQPEVEYAEPNFIARMDPGERVNLPTPPPTPIAQRTNRGRTAAVIAGTPTDADYQAYQWNFQLIKMPSAWDIQPGGSSNIIVAVIDTGITSSTGNLVYPIWTGSTFQTLTMPYATNPDLPASRHTRPKDFVGSPGAPLVDLDGHSTHVSGTIGEATNNAALVSGMAYNVTIMPIKVCSTYWDAMIARGIKGTPGFAPDSEITCLYADIANAIQYAVDNGARVLNISLGGPTSSTTLQNALIYAAGKGAFVAIAMGNEFEHSNPVIYPASYASGIDGVMSVASVGYNSAKAYYSSTGSYCEIAAPGGDARSGTGRVDGGVIWQSTLIGSDQGGLIPRFDRYDKQPYQGTSMASPHVAGLAALLMSQMPSLTGAQVEKIIRASAMDLGVTGKDDSFGYGLIQPRRALFGFGPLR